MAGINQTLVTIPEMHNFDDVRQAMANAIKQVQSNIANQLPVTNMQGKPLTNVGLPVAADDAVTLKFLQAGGSIIVPPPAVTNNVTNVTSSATLATFVFPTLTVSETTNWLYAPFSLSPTALVATLVGTSTGTTSARFEVSTNSGSTWNLITAAELTIPPLTVVSSNVTTFSISPILTGNLLRAKIGSTSAVDGTNLTMVAKF